MATGFEAGLLAAQYCAYRRARDDGLDDGDALALVERFKKLPVASSFVEFLEQIDGLIQEVA